MLQSLEISRTHGKLSFSPKCTAEISCLTTCYFSKISYVDIFQFNFLADKKDAVFYNDKYVRNRIAPSLQQFGGGAEDGWIVVTSTGLVCTK